MLDPKLQLLVETDFGRNRIEEIRYFRRSSPAQRSTARPGNAFEVSDRTSSHVFA
jgi:hypothetical protein